MTNRTPAGDLNRRRIFFTTRASFFFLQRHQHDLDPAVLGLVLARIVGRDGLILSITRRSEQSETHTAPADSGRPCSAGPRAVESSQFEGNFSTSPAPMGTLSLWPSTLPVIRIFSVFADQLENALVRDTTADAVHQDVVIDRVEELRKIEVHGAAVSFS